HKPARTVLRGRKLPGGVIVGAFCNFVDISLSSGKIITMIAVKGIYENGIVRLDRRIKAKRSMKVIVTFLDDETQDDSKRLTTKDFSFLKSREDSKRYKGSLSDSVIEDRKEEI
ncbi:MAG TPA: hypothetical protein VE912_16535, partial [Bacteroidales bacterium]|nr:hypothetical protein [Bacteroidales bacterium]